MQTWVSVLHYELQDHPPITVVPCGIITAAVAGTRLAVAVICVPIALAWSAVGEAPLAGLAVGTAPSTGPCPTRTLTRHWVTLVAVGS